MNRNKDNESSRSGTDPDEDLIQRARKGETYAFRVLVNNHKEKAVCMAYAALGNLADAQDAVQEAFVRVYRGMNNFESQARFSTWFYRILVNICRDELRRRKSSRAVIDHSEENKPEALSKENNPAQALVNKELAEKINRAMSCLSDQQQVAFAMKYKQGMKINEIAGIMNLEISTVKAHLFRAVRKLQGLLFESKGGR